MSTSTTNLKLVKPSYNETADIAVINANMDVIDGAITTINGKLTSLDSAVDELSDPSRERNVLSSSDMKTLSGNIAEGHLGKYKPGDYFTGSSGYIYTLADMDTFYSGYGSYATLSQHHAAFFVYTDIRTAWNTADNTTGGYASSTLHNVLTGTALPKVKTDIAAITGEAWSSHMLSHQKLYSNEVNATRYNRYGLNNGASSNWKWFEDQYISALTEPQVYGTIAWSSSGYDIGEGYRQLDVFRNYHPQEIVGNIWWWTRAVASSSDAASVISRGNASRPSASRTDVRACGLILYK